MNFSIIVATLIAAVAAQASDDTCSAPITVTVTETLSYGIRTPSAPASLAVTAPAPYPTGSAALPPVVPTSAASTPLPSVASYGTASPSGTGAYSAPVSEFTGAAANLKVGGVVAGVGAGVGAFAALFL
ncbi:uncharacterized protein EKO05_0006163 [Ascochyta rabiei]|uniref:Uncharacterized protein n=1 Tax=Didymella rabiei TaxID=5454 RepID=A0A163AUP0_DIDRA|nr:uncharacterized protein EKO05_0006163 [Ascochyta rabiei]KZM21402.1 hypothetical protein ST47_g7458 [Ascochyta rabiei]UPX15723.1 hypothetical protein EKO05_0006163 [Ascochyta rabiei]